MSFLRSPALRTTLRNPAFRRFASTEPEKQAAATTKSAVEQAQERAGEALVGLGKLGGAVGDRLGSLLGSYREPLFYNLAVLREIAKQVYVAEKLAPPLNGSAWTEAYSTLFSRVSNMNYWREVLRSGAWAKLGVYALEAYGIFKIGEMVGRRSIVGYTLEE